MFTSTPPPCSSPASLPQKMGLDSARDKDQGSRGGSKYGRFLHLHGHLQNQYHSNEPGGQQGQGVRIVSTTIYLGPLSYRIGKVGIPILRKGSDIFLKGVLGLGVGGEGGGHTPQ